MKILSIFILFIVLVAQGEAQLRDWFKKKEKKQEVPEFTGKVWEKSDREPVVYEKNGNIATFNRVNGSGQPENSFAANVWHRADRLRASAEDFAIRFQGTCASQILVRARFDTIEAFDKFTGSKDIETLTILDPLEPLVSGFRDQCDALESIRVWLTYPGEEGMQEFRGTMGEESDWKLVEGFSSPRDDYQINIVTHLFMGDYLISYKGKPRRHVVADIKYAYPNTSSLLVKEDNTHDFERIAKNFVERYLTEDPDVESFVFRLPYLPKGYSMVEGEGFGLLAEKEDDWKIELLNLVDRRYEKPLISSYEDVMVYLENRNYETLLEYKRIFEAFFVDFTYAYGKYCTEYVENRTQVEITLINQRYDGNGRLLSEEEYGPPSILNIQEDLLPLYKSYSARVRKTLVFQTMADAANAMRSPAMYSSYRSINLRINRINALNPVVQSNCGTERSKTIYKHLAEFAKQYR